MNKKVLILLSGILFYYFGSMIASEEEQRMLYVFLETLINKTVPVYVNNSSNRLWAEGSNFYDQNTFFTLCSEQIRYCSSLVACALINKPSNKICRPFIEEEYKNLVDKLKYWHVIRDLQQLTLFTCDDKKLLRDQTFFYAQYADVLRLLVHYDLNRKKPICPNIMSNLVSFFVKYKNQKDVLARHAIADSFFYEAVCLLFIKLAEGFLVKNSNGFCEQSFYVDSMFLHDKYIPINNFVVWHARNDCFCSHRNLKNISGLLAHTYIIKQKRLNSNGLY